MHFFDREFGGGSGGNVDGLYGKPGEGGNGTGLGGIYYDHVSGTYRDITTYRVVSQGTFISVIKTYRDNWIVFGNDASSTMGNDYVVGQGGKYLGEKAYNYVNVKGLTVESSYGFSPDPNRIGYVERRGGVEIKLSYPTETGRWAQLIYYGQTTPYWDVPEGTSSIYYQSQYNTEGNQYFYDMPTRYEDCSRRAELMLFDRGFLILELSYGFSIVNGKTMVIPLRVILP